VRAAEFRLISSGQSAGYIVEAFNFQLTHGSSLPYTYRVRQINVTVDDDVYEGAKVTAARCGMKFKAWVARALDAATDPRDRLKTPEKQEPRYAPLDD
jgi:hypothetical protein